MAVDPANNLVVLLDDSSDSSDNTNTPKDFKAWIEMAPVPKASVAHGPGRGRGRGRGWPTRTYLPSNTRKKMHQLSTLVKAAAESSGFKRIPRGVPVQVSLWFYIRRPDEDFVNRQRAEGRLKPNALENKTVVAVKPDIDNFAKFVLDSITGVLYDDDAQVSILQMHKSRDNSGTCEGRIAIQVCACSRTATAFLPDF